ncbi:MAG TPA: diguanylate cyclase [Pyrinomonadaceae bacterium]|nr:diguanylate cyclase [Pyrinomonadaceae bacterium]
MDGLNAHARAEVLLRAGCLSSSIASVQRTAGRQEAAKDLISESIRIFESLGEAGRVAEAEVELAWCYWREGAFDETRTMLRHAVRLLGEGGNPHVRAVALLRSAIVEIETDQLREALRILTDAAPLFEVGDKHALKGSFHNTLAVVYESLGSAPGAGAYVDRALVEYAAASFHFEQAGHVRYRARVENNIGLLFYKIARFGEAFEHLRCARRLFAELGDGYSIAQVDDTQARALLAQGKTAEAEELARAVVRTLERGDQQSLLAEALTTHGVALGRLKRAERAYAVLLRAAEVAEEVGDYEGAGSAALALLEEVGDCLSPAEVCSLYERADQFLAHSQNPEHLRRLRLCARRAVSATVRPGKLTAHSFTHVSEKASSVVREALHTAALNVPVLLRGELGTGKEALARLIHEWSGRAGKFVVLDCAALPECPDEAQLLDHELDAPPHEGGRRPRLCSEVAGGTLFLDEVGDLSTKNQAAVLRLLTRGVVPRVSAAASRGGDVRIIAATRRDLRQEVASGAFRADLLNALSAFRVEIPPLRARAEDIPVMARGLIEDAGGRHGKRVTFTPESVEAMRQLALKANGRELRELIEHTFSTAADGAVVSAEAVDTVAMRESRKGDFADPWADCSLEEEVRHYEGRLIQSALNAAQGRVTRAAHLLGITHQSLAFIINARQRDLISQRRPARKRRASVIRPALKKELEKERMLARTDELTGIANKRAFHEAVSAEIRRSARYRHPFTVAFLDVDDFKRVNDQHGHGVGDSILRTISGSIKASLRAADVVARLGGDEFAILLPETGKEAAQAALRNVQDNLAVAMHERGIPVTLSVGAVTCLNPKCEVDELIGVADSQMYAAKFGRKGSANFVTLEEGP